MKQLMTLSAAALLCLGACASPTELRGGKPDIDVTTAKAADRVAGCIGDEFEKANTNVAFAPGTTFNTRPTANGGFSISGVQSGSMLFGGNDTILLVDVTKADAGTHVTMFDHVLTGQGKWTALVRSCL